MNPLRNKKTPLLFLYHNQKGLTLIELLAVILILGILAAITIPVISGQGEGARVQAYKDTVISIEQAANRFDLEEGFRTAEAADDYGVVNQSHSLYVQGHLDNLPENPWNGTNSEQSDFQFIITKDVREAKKAFLVGLNGTSVEKILFLNEEDEVEVISESESNLTFIDDESDFLDDMDAEDYLNYYYYNPS